MGCGLSRNHVKPILIAEKEKVFTLTRFLRLRFKDEVAHEDITAKLCELVGDDARTFKIETEKPGVYIVTIAGKSGKGVDKEEQDMIVATTTKKLENARGLQLACGEKIMGAKEFKVAGEL